MKMIWIVFCCHLFYFGVIIKAGYFYFLLYLPHVNFWLKCKIYSTPYSRIIFTQFFLFRLLSYRRAQHVFWTFVQFRSPSFPLFISRLICCYISLWELNINVLIETVISVKYAQFLNKKSKFVDKLMEKQFSIFNVNPPNKNCVLSTVLILCTVRLSCLRCI